MAGLHPRPDVTASRKKSRLTLWESNRATQRVETWHSDRCVISRCHRIRKRKQNLCVQRDVRTRRFQTSQSSIDSIGAVVLIGCRKTDITQRKQRLWGYTANSCRDYPAVLCYVVYHYEGLRDIRFDRVVFYCCFRLCNFSFTTDYTLVHYICSFEIRSAQPVLLCEPLIRFAFSPV